MTVVAIAGLVVGLVGGGISYAASTSAAKSQEQFALLNAQAGLQQTRAQGQAAAMQAELQATQEKVAQRSAQNNAQAMREQTEAQTRIDQENIRKSRLEFEMKLGSARAAGAGSGVVDTSGSPLDVLVSASEAQAHFEAEQGWQADSNRRKGYRQAQVEEMQGRAHGINAGLAQIDGLAAVERARMQGTQIQLGAFGAQATAQGQQMAALGGLMSGVSSSAGGFSNYLQYRNPRYS